MKKILLFICSLLALDGFAQFNPLQSQYMFNQVVINPAYAGAGEMLSLNAGYRKQWLGMNGSPETFSFAAHTPLRNRHFNLGFVAAQDNVAVLHHTSVSLVYAYRFHLRRFSFAAGISPGVIFERNSWNEISTGQPGDESYEGVIEKRTSYQAGFGLYGSGKRFFIGISSRAVFFGTETGISNQPILLYTGYRFGERELISVIPSVLGRMIPGSFYQADLNLLVYLKDRIGAGVSYRLQDAAAGLIDVRVNEQLHVGYSYDYTLSHLSTHTTGSHELTLRYDFSYTVRTPSPRNL